MILKKEISEKIFRKSLSSEKRNFCLFQLFFKIREKYIFSRNLYISIYLISYLNSQYSISSKFPLGRGTTKTDIFLKYFSPNHQNLVLSATIKTFI